MTVTGETITDEQIRELWKHGGNAITGRTLFIALGEPFPWGEYPSADEIARGRALCAESWNARLETTVETGSGEIPARSPK